MASDTEKLAIIRADLMAGRPVQPLSVRTFLSWFGAQRRGSWIVFYINHRLAEAGLVTQPDFQSTYIDALINIELSGERKDGTREADVHSSAEQSVDAQPSEAVETVLSSPASKDPTYRVSRLQAANQTIISINPNATITEVVTILMSTNISQIPVMTNERDVRGIITWKSIGSRSILKGGGSGVQDYMETHHEIRHDTSIFDAIPIIVANDYVLVRGIDNKISGIITASDLNINLEVLQSPSFYSARSRI